MEGRDGIFGHAFYSIGAGDLQEEIVANTTNLVHAVFACNFRHGDKTLFTTKVDSARAWFLTWCPMTQLHPCATS